MTYRIWSIEHNAWFEPKGLGSAYTTHRARAGIYSEKEANRICGLYNSPTYDVPGVAMVPVEAGQAEEWIQSSIIKVAGKPFRCECGCNVFAKSRQNPNRYKCNACETVFSSE